MPSAREDPPFLTSSPDSWAGDVHIIRTRVCLGRHPLAGPRQVSKQHPRLPEQPVSSSNARMQWPSASVSSILAATDRARHPMWIKRAAVQPAPFALAAMPPRKNVGTAMRPGDSYKFGAAGIPAPIHRWLALQAVRVTAHRGTAARHPIQVPGAVAQSSHGACRSPSKVLREAACHIKRFVLLQNMEAGSRQFVRECLACDDRVSPGFLALIKTLGLGAIALGEVGRFHEGP